MASKHEDGSVTLSAQEFRCCAAFMEMSSSKFYEFLTENDDGFTKEQLIQKLKQYAHVDSCATDGLAH